MPEFSVSLQFQLRPQINDLVFGLESHPSPGAKRSQSRPEGGEGAR